MGRLNGKRAIVTGAGSGIGRASARLFAAEGAAVLAVDRAEAALAETVAAITGAGGRAVALAADVGNATRPRSRAISPGRSGSSAGST
jgi:NAD(P)-dependent dehydrogenase (short-subunit alcohol dehydrogenase family)